jgi:hypothetical protein
VRYARQSSTPAIVGRSRPPAAGKHHANVDPSGVPLRSTPRAYETILTIHSHAVRPTSVRFIGWTIDRTILLMRVMLLMLAV